MSTEALTTSEIEGEILDRARVQSSIQRQLGWAADDWRAAPAERGVSEMMVNLYKTFASPLSDDTLFGWHRMLMTGRQNLTDIGRYRTSSEPMQVLSGAMGSPKIHFEAPPSAKVPSEIKQFITWFNRTAPGGPEPSPALTRAGAAHLYFESIHPFEDGIGRALAEKSLAQSLGQPSLIALCGNDPCAARALLCRAGSSQQKQRNQGFKGGVSAGKYSTITQASPATTTRDLADLTEKGALIREGERRHAPQTECSFAARAASFGL